MTVSSRFSGAAAGRLATVAAVMLASFAATPARALPIRSQATEITSFEMDKAPSGMYYYETQSLLYVLCGTQTNDDHYLYAMTATGEQRCFITIPKAVGMSRVDGFYIQGNDAYIVDSQGPIYAGDAGKLGGSVYRVDWTNPCGCAAGGTCSSSTVTWSPTVTATWTLAATESSINDGGGNDQYFRNSGIVISGNSFYGVNGVHPNPDLTCCYPKSIVRVNMTTANQKAAGDAQASQKWSFDASTLGHDVDMEGLTCGPDDCASALYVGDEYNYVYKLTLSDTDSSTAVTNEWNLRAYVGNVNDDKGIESLTYSSSTGHFYAGIQGSSMVHVVSLSDTPCVPDDPICYFESASLSVAVIIMGIIVSLPLLILGCVTMCLVHKVSEKKWAVDSTEIVGDSSLRGLIGGGVVSAPAMVVAGIISGDVNHYLPPTIALFLFAILRLVVHVKNGKNAENIKATVGEIVLGAILLVAFIIGSDEAVLKTSTDFEVYVYIIVGIVCLPLLLLSLKVSIKPESMFTLIGLEPKDPNGHATVRAGCGALLMTCPVAGILGLATGEPAFLLDAGIIMLAMTGGRIVSLVADGRNGQVFRPTIIEGILGVIFTAMYIISVML